jgi:diadenosine tetraphosphate (Ap4A) HIT family hydrolase
MSGCPFCNIKEAVLLRNQFAFAINDKNPISPGHSLIVPIPHVPNIFSLSPEPYQACFELLRTLKQSLEKTHSPDGFNVVVNNGSAAGQTVDHAHIHLVPRYLNDSLDVRDRCLDMSGNDAPYSRES